MMDCFSKVLALCPFFPWCNQNICACIFIAFLYYTYIVDNLGNLCQMVEMREFIAFEKPFVGDDVTSCRRNGGHVSENES